MACRQRPSSTVVGHGQVRQPTWPSLSVPIPAELQGSAIAIELVATDGGHDSTVEAGVDQLRITSN